MPRFVRGSAVSWNVFIVSLLINVLLKIKLLLMLKSDCKDKQYFPICQTICSPYLEKKSPPPDGKWNFKHADPACLCGPAASTRGIRADGRRFFLFRSMQGGACPQVGSPFGQSPQSRIFAGFIDRPKATIPTNEKTKITSAYKKMGINHAQKASSRLRRNPGKTQNHRRMNAEFLFLF